MIPNGFAQGRMRYLDHLPDRPDESRIVLTVTFGEQVATIAAVDTGSPFTILQPDVAAPILENALRVGEIRSHALRGVTRKGHLYRIPARLEAEDGASLTVEATVFVADLLPGDHWLLPNLIGLAGFLERIRFAVDPTQNYFYFGSIETLM